MGSIPTQTRREVWERECGVSTCLPSGAGRLPARWWSLLTVQSRQARLERWRCPSSVGRVGDNTPSLSSPSGAGGWFSLLVTYAKPYLSISEQVALLQRRGLVVPDVAAAERWLYLVGYYRASGYSYVWRQQQPGTQDRSDDFQPGTRFQQVVDLYEFDRSLKQLILQGLERVEIMMRVRVGHVLGRRDPYGHEIPACLDVEFTKPRLRGSGRTVPSVHSDWLQDAAKKQTRSREDFVEHYRRRYGGRLPVWVVTEILDFGSLSYLYSGLLLPDRAEIALGLNIVNAAGLGNEAALVNWMRTLNYVRNVCAHHSRLWNRNMDEKIATKHLATIPELAHISVASAASPANTPASATTRVYAAIAVLTYLIEHSCPDPAWKSLLTAALNTDLPGSGRSVTEMGFPDDWGSEPLWSS